MQSPPSAAFIDFAALAGDPHWADGLAGCFPSPTFRMLDARHRRMKPLPGSVPNGLDAACDGGGIDDQDLLELAGIPGLRVAAHSDGRNLRLFAISALTAAGRTDPRRRVAASTDALSRLPRKSGQSRRGAEADAVPGARLPGERRKQTRRAQARRML